MGKKKQKQAAKAKDDLAASSCVEEASSTAATAKEELSVSADARVADIQKGKRNSKEGLPAPTNAGAHLLPEITDSAMQASITSRDKEKQLSTHYYVKIAVSTFLCALLLIIGVPVFMESRVTGSLAYTALGVVLVAFGLILALAVVVLLFKPPFKDRMNK